MFQRWLGKAAKIYLMKERSWNLINEENLIFSWAKDRMKPNAGVRVWEAARIGPGAAHIRVCCCLWLMIELYLLSAINLLFPGQSPSKAEDDSQGSAFGSRGRIAGDRDDGLEDRSHLQGCSDQSIRFSTSFRSTLYACVFESWLTHSVISHLLSEGPSDDIVPLH